MPLGEREDDADEYRDEGYDDEDGGAGGVGPGGGQHPLEGIEGVDDLPIPETLESKAK